MTPAKENIRSALKTLLQKYPYQEITIQAICDTAGLSRKTFSRYFSGKEEVVVSQLRHDTINPVKSLMELLPLNKIEGSTQMVLERVYTAFYENRDYYLKVIESLGVMWLVEQMLDIPLILGERPYEENDIPAGEEDFVVSFLNGVNAVAIKWWIEEGFQTTPKQLATMVAEWAYVRVDQLRIKNK